MTEDRILEFLDGTLSSHEEEELLHRLAVSPERRQLLKQHMRIREVTQGLSRREQYAVPCAVSSSLSTKLFAAGYAGPALTGVSQEIAAGSQVAAAVASGTAGTGAGLIAANRGIFGTTFSFTSILITSVASFMLGIGAFLAINQGGDDTATAPTAKEHQAALVTAEHNSEGVSSQLNPGQAIALREVVGPVEEGLSLNSTTAGRALPPRARHSVIDPKYGVSKIPQTRFSDNGVQGQTDDVVAIDDEETSGLDPIIQVGIREERDLSPRVASTTIGSQRFGVEPASSQILPPLSMSFRLGAGNLLGMDAYSGSLGEFKLSWKYDEWLITRASVGSLNPKVTSGKDLGRNAAGESLIGTEKQLQFITVAGAEIGFSFERLGVPVEVTGGVLTDERGNLYPRASIASFVPLTYDLSFHFGIEGMLYQNDVAGSVERMMKMYSDDRPVYIGAPTSSERAGFIGPFLEMAWHF